MGDPVFEACLNQKAWVCRPRVRLQGDLVAARPAYQVVGGIQRLRVRPAWERFDETIVGKAPLCTDVGYMEPGDVAVGDRLAVIDGQRRLAATVEAGQDTLLLEEGPAMQPGTVLHLHSGLEVEQVAVVGALGGVTSVEPELRHQHLAEENVWVVRLYEVQGVFDEGGAGHHWKVALEEMG